MGCGSASGRRGSPKAHPCACGELAHFLCAILRTFRRSLAVFEGPRLARFLRAGWREANCSFPLWTKPRKASSKQSLSGAPVLRW